MQLSASIALASDPSIIMISARRSIIAASIVFSGLLGLAAIGKTEERVANRFPFDPACAWGRLADGRGMVVRCLTQPEAAQLGAIKTAAQSGTTTSTIAGIQSSPSGTTTLASAETTDKKSATDVRAEPLEVEVVSVTADEGALPIARRKLHLPQDKYARCVADNGGLTGESGEITIRFLVRERGRAEGTSVEKRSGVSEAAARCIASVVDRRPVGTPEGPAVGATAVFRVTKHSKSATGR